MELTPSPAIRALVQAIHSSPRREVLDKLHLVLQHLAPEFCDLVPPPPETPK